MKDNRFVANSCVLIHGKQLVLDAAQNERVQPRTKIHLAADDGREFLTVTKVLEAGVFQHARFKFRQHGYGMPSNAFENVGDQIWSAAAAVHWGWRVV